MTMLGSILLAGALLVAASFAARRWHKALRPVGIVLLLVLLPAGYLYFQPVLAALHGALGPR